MKKRILALLTVLFLLGTLPLTAFAQSTVDLEKIGSIQVKVVYNGTTPLKNLKLTCIRVGTLELVDGEYKYLRAYDKKELTNMQSSALPEQLLTFVKDNSSNYKFTQLEERVDEKGYATFSNCTPGLYLIIQEDDYTLNGKKYDKIKPFLVTIPYEGKYDVKPTSKTALDVYKPTETTQTTKPGSSLPQTGQLNWPVPALAASGMLLFALGWMLRSDGRKDGYEE